MIHFFQKNNSFFGVKTSKNLSPLDIPKLEWLFGDALLCAATTIKPDNDNVFIGPRASMITPWSTNAVEICQNMGIEGIERIEMFETVLKQEVVFDKMLSQKYDYLSQDIFDNNQQPNPIILIKDIEKYNQQEGLSLSAEEVAYLNELSNKLGRNLTDSEVFGFSQINSEHCRHKIFNGQFIIDGKPQEASLFSMIKETAAKNPNTIVSAYKDNVAFVAGPTVEQFSPKTGDKADFYEKKYFDSVLSLKAETHNFPTTVEPFSGAATGTGGEIRDRLAGGQGSLPLAGTAVYMTANSRIQENIGFEDRNWLYQTPIDILIKASNGASDFGNKFGQPLICGSVLTFEHFEDNPTFDNRKLGFDKVIMQAGGIGFAKANQAQKKEPQKGDKIVVLGGDNYRIGMGGAAVSSADTGTTDAAIELNAIQRSNPEMQKRVSNVIRTIVENDENLIVSIHDHGAGGHLNCLSELVENTGGNIDLDQLPIGDPSLSAKEIIGNESQERMGLVVKAKDIEYLEHIAQRERAPMYVVGEITNDHRFVIEGKKSQQKPMDLAIDEMFGKAPKLTIEDQTILRNYSEIEYNQNDFEQYLKKVLQLEAVACKDWLTNKVDRCVGGKVAKQQCVGALQLPLNNVAVMALDYNGTEGVATAIGHSPVAGLINPEAASRNAIAEALSNLVFAPLKDGLTSVSLSANWMWACKNEGEDARLYSAVNACASMAIDLGINIPTGKDSLSMKQKYKNDAVIAPGTVIISAIGHCNEITKVVEPVLKHNFGSIYYLNLSKDNFHLGGSSFGQVLNKVGTECPDIKDVVYFKNAFNVIQNLIKDNQIIAGHDIGSGGLITTLLEMCFADNNLGAKLNFSEFIEKDFIKILFSENIGLVLQPKNDKDFEQVLTNNQIEFYKIGNVTKDEFLVLNTNENDSITLNITDYRKIWFETSYKLDALQTKNNKAKERFDNLGKQPLLYEFPKNFNGLKPNFVTQKPRPKAAIIREKGSNSERELANALYEAGFDVKDIHTTDLISGTENLEDVQFIGAVGGFSNSDVLGSAKGWAGALRYNEKAKTALTNFFNRKDTLSVGICNGCQLFMELDLINPDHQQHGKMKHNDSQKHESNFTSVTIQKNISVMLSSLEGATLGVWISHGEGKFWLPNAETDYNIVGKYAYAGYPANPNGSDYNTAMMSDKTGRHLVMMPHIERSLYPWNWAYYPENNHEISPWIEAFVNAREWILNFEF